MHIDCRNDEKQLFLSRFSSPWVRILRLQYFEYFMPAEGGRNGKTECSMTVRQLPTIFPGFSYCHIAVDEYVDVQAADSNAIFLGERCVA